MARIALAVIALLALAVQTWLLWRTGTDARLVLLSGLLQLSALTAVCWLASADQRAVIASTQVIEESVQRAIKGKLDERVDPARIGPELSRTADVLNLFLARVESLVHGLRNISGNIAHEMATPIAIAVERGRTLSEEADEMPSDVLDLVEQVELLQQLYANVLDVVELEAGNALVLDVIDIQDVVLEASVMFEDTAEELEVSFSVDCEPALVNGNYWLLLQAIGNLLSNALRFTPRGGLVCMSARTVGEGVQFLIEDSGKGVSDETLEDLLKRINRQRSEPDQVDHGLGLRMVHATIIRHGGKMDLAPTRLGGFAVEISLPSAINLDGQHQR